MLVLVEGFDHEDGDSGGNSLWMKHWSTSGFNEIVAGRVPYSANSRCAGVIDNNLMSKVLDGGVTCSTIIVGFAIRPGAGVGGISMDIFNILAGGVSKMSMSLDYAGRILVHDSVGALIGTGTTLLISGAWTYVEVKLVKGATGTVEVHVNGVSGEIGSSVGNFGTSNYDEIAFQAQALGAVNFYDDVYACDTTGSTNNDFLGDIVVETLYPTADGFHHDWTPDTGVVHFSRVNEGQIDGDTSYVHTTNAGDIDTYPMDTLAGGPVLGVQLNLGIRKNDGGARTIAPLIRLAGTDYVGTTVALSASYLFYSTIYDQDPTSTNWLYTTVNSAEFGIKLVA